MPVNPSDQSLEARVQDLLRRVDTLERANPMENTTIGRGGVTLTSGGAITVVDTNGHVVATIGALPSAFNRSDGSTQPGLIFYREDGTVAGFLGDLNPTVAPYKQSWQILDRQGNVIFADDTNGGVGIALPYLVFGVPKSNNVPTDVTTSSTFTTLQACVGYWMSAKVTCQILVYSSDAATTGEVRVIDENNVQVGATITVAGSQFNYANWGPVVLPGNFSHSKVLSFQARRTAGTGNIGLNPLAVIGMQS